MNEFLLYQLAAFSEAQGHDGADIVGGRDDGSPDVRLFDAVYHCGIGHAAGVMHLRHVSLLVIDVVGNVRHCGDHVHVELPVEAFLHDLHVQQSEEAATESESQCQRRLRLEGQRGIVQLQFLQRRAQVFEVLRLNRIHTGEDHRFHLFESGDCLRAGARYVGDGIAHFHFLGGLDAGDDVSHVSCAQLLAWHHVHLEHAYFVGIIFLSGIEEFHFVSLADHAVHNLEIGDDAAERVEYRVENQRLQGGFLVAFGMGYAFDHCCQYLFHAHACLAGGTDDVATLAAEQVYDFVFHLFGHCACHVAFVDDGDNLQVVFDGHVEVGDGLCLHALRGIHYQQCSFASGDGTGNFVREVHVSRSINQIQNIFLTFVHVLHLDGMALDGNPSLFLQIHIIKHLALGYLYRIGKLKQTVCQGRLAVVNVGYNAEITYILHLLSYS